jgi:hypothetical protein
MSMERCEKIIGKEKTEVLGKKPALVPVFPP